MSHGYAQVRLSVDAELGDETDIGNVNFYPPFPSPLTMNLMQDFTLEVSDEPAVLRITWQVEVSRENLIEATVSCLLGHSLMIGIGIYLIELGPGVLIFVVFVALFFLVSIATLVDAWFGTRTELLELSTEFFIVSTCFPHDVLALHDTNTEEFLRTFPWARRRTIYPAQSIKKFRLDRAHECYGIVCELSDDSEVKLMKTRNGVDAKNLETVLCNYVQRTNGEMLLSAPAE